MPVDVDITNDAATFRDAMDRRHRKRYDDWLQELQSQGCEAMGYRMYGEFVERFCVKHLYDTDRAIVAFESPRQVTIVALGRHNAKNPSRDIYAWLYRVAGIEPPVGERTKPACCDAEGLPPDGSGVMDELVDRIREVAKSTRRRGGRHH
ncbi:hypothetical protein PV458_09465 [Streptomyces sp. MN03-5084-2B]|nr:hypothetical protein [Streptomyces sp. MN03-5084-2B]